VAPKTEEPDEISEFWKTELDRQNQEYEEQQRVLEAQQQQALLQQQQAQAQAQRDFEEQQRRLAEEQRRQQEALMTQQAQWQTQGRLAELEQENLNARAQYERDQLMLQQYDQRVKALEGELANIQNNFGQQITSKDDQIRALQEQVNTWRSKYEALAKLYSQLRHEHLDLLQKFKSVQLKAASAQEAIDRREKLERELKTKNLELADMIRERDRAMHEKDRLKGGNKDEVEKLKRELRMAQDKADNLERSKGNELSTMLAKYNREMADLEEALRNKSRALEEAQDKLRNGNTDLEQLLRDKEEELEVYKAAMDQTLIEFNELKQNQGHTDDALDGQIDALIMANMDKINDIIDSVLQTGVQRVDDAIYELDSTMQAGNQNASPSYVLSQIEKASSSAMEFATSFNNFIADGPNSTPSELIKNVNVFSGAIADVCSNTKGLMRLATDDKKSDSLINGSRQSAQSTVRFFRGLLSFRLEGMDPIQKTDVVINSNNDLQMNLQKLNKLVETFAPGFGKLANKGDLGEIVDQELSKAADAIAAAAARLAKLRNKPRDGYSTYELKVHDSILDAALAITDAIARLIKAATVTQQEIVQAGRGSSSRTAFYKKNNRWTEGLISAAKAVASSTNTLIETADGVLSNRNSPEQLIVASNDVAASTAQLVAASRVKAGFMSKSQDNLEQASKAVGAACRALVRQVQAMLKDRNAEDEEVDYSKLGHHEFKVREMEQQVRSLLSYPSTCISNAVMLTMTLCYPGRDPEAGELTLAGQAQTRRDEEDILPGGVGVRQWLCAWEKQHRLKRVPYIYYISVWLCRKCGRYRGREQSVRAALMLPNIHLLVILTISMHFHLFTVLQCLSPGRKWSGRMCPWLESPLEADAHSVLSSPTSHLSCPDLALSFWFSSFWLSSFFNPTPEFSLLRCTDQANPEPSASPNHLPTRR
jgi:hypothetical protein